MKSTSFKKGQKTSRLYDEDRKQFSENYRQKLINISQQKIKDLKVKGFRLESKINETQTALRDRNELPEIYNKRSFNRGIFLGTPSIIGIWAEMGMIWWTLLPFGLYFTGFLIAMALALLGVVAIELYLVHIRQVFPELYEKVMLHSSIICVFIFLISICFLAGIRVDLFLTHAFSQSGSLEGQIVGAEKFYDSSKQDIMWFMPLLALLIPIGCGICLHEALERIIVSGSALRDYSRIRKMRIQQESILNKISIWELWLQNEMHDFEAGLFFGVEHESKKNLEKYLVSPFLILILVILTILILKGIARGSDETYSKSVIILFDLSGSSRSKDYSQKEEFQKNTGAVPKIIRQLTPGTYLRVIGITEKSFSQPYIMLEGIIPNDKGVFNEKLAQAKVNFINAWKKISLNPNAQHTDIFGAINLASNLLGGQDRTEKKLIIISDMRECGRQFNLEKPRRIDASILTKVKDSGLIPSLKGVKVWILGVHSSGKTEVYWNTLKEFWLRYFNQAGAQIINYSIDRRWNYE